MAVIKQQILQLQDETKNSLRRIWKENEHLLDSLHYFIRLALDWYSPEKRTNMKPKVAVIGTDIPEELIIAAGVTPYWIIGGSQASTLWSDDLIPRDTDPISRSILGHIHEPGGVDFSDTLFIIPANSDSSRKIAFLLMQEGRKVFTLDIPPEREEESAKESYADSVENMLEEVCSHTKKIITGVSLRAGISAVSQARYRLKNFLNAAAGNCIIRGSAVMLVANSYYYADNIAEWSDHLKELTDEILCLTNRNASFSRKTGISSNTQDFPNVLLMGSPVIFPNYKVPFLIEDVGLNIAGNIGAGDEKIQLCGMGSRRKRAAVDTTIRQIAEEYLDISSSGAYTKNRELEGKVNLAIKNEIIEGVVFHILKGQIEYDFELLRYEKLFEKAGIPVFRLETDYQYQDIEQLRIRMEAFSEMLKHYHIVKVI